jgi:uncharacterized protein YpuA (DUF1002 family)
MESDLDNPNNTDLILDDVDVTINENSYSDIPECIHEIKDKENCNPYLLACNACCQGNGICLLNPLSICYNMSMEEYKKYMQDLKDMEKEFEDFLDSSEGKELLEEIKNSL